MWPWLAAVVAIDVAITGFVIRRVLRRRAAVANGAAPTVFTLDIRTLRQFTDAMHPRIGEYVRANWSGIPDDLPAVLEHLLGELATEAKARNLPLDRDLLKQMLAGSLHSHRVGRSSQVRDALAKVA
jgi:hypothetical protein